MKESRNWRMIQTENAVLVLKRELDTDEDFIAFVNTLTVRGIHMWQV